MTRPAFSYQKTNSNYISFYKDGKWDHGKLQTEDTISIAVTSTSIHYGQQAFEGLKAYRRKDGRVQLFRPYDNAKRFQDSCSRLMMPTIDVDIFVEAVKKTVLDNIEFVPPYEKGQSLYIRPYMIGIGNNLGVKPSAEYLFGIVVSPVGTYFDFESKPVEMVTASYDRAAPYGTGQAKVGGNYAASLYPKHLATQQGFADCIYLDPKTHTKIEEVGAANFFGITKDNCYITPTSPSILNSITNRSLKYIAKNYLKMEVLEADVYIDDLSSIVEAGACGTAAIITPIAAITHHDKRHQFPVHQEMGKVSKELLRILTGIQYGDLEDPSDWIVVIN